MPSNNRNAQNKIKAQKAKALREKLGHTKKNNNDDDISTKAKANRAKQQAYNEKKYRLKKAKATKIEEAGGKTKYDAIVFEKKLSEYGMNIFNKNKKMKEEIFKLE
jgi:hypothetical protein